MSDERAGKEQSGVGASAAESWEHVCPATYALSDGRRGVTEAKVTLDRSVAACPGCGQRRDATRWDAPAYTRAPQVPESIADDLIFAMKRGWITLPVATASNDPEASERLTRLFELLKWARSDRGA